MPVVVVNAPPFLLQKPTLKVGPVGSEVQYECGADEIVAEPEQDSSDVETFCGTFTSYKPAKWTITVTVLQSFGATAIWNSLRPLVNTVQPFLIVPDGRVAVSVTNVGMQGTAYIPEFSYLNAPVGEASEFDFVLAVQGVPSFITTPPVFADEESAPE